MALELRSCIRASWLCYEESVPVNVCLCHEPVVITGRLENIDTGQEKMELSYYRNSRWKTLIAPRSTLLSKNALIRLADSGLPVSSDNVEGVVRYLTAYEAANSAVIPFTRSIDRIGWLGREFYPYATNSEIAYEGDDSDGIIGALREHGDYDLWLKTAAELRKSPFARAMLAGSFASPLLEQLQHRTVLGHWWHNTRSGKTAALKFCLSVYGDPIKGDMAVVGPRPLLVQYLPRYNAHQARRHEVRPGFTGLCEKCFYELYPLSGTFDSDGYVRPAGQDQNQNKKE